MACVGAGPVAADPPAPPGSRGDAGVHRRAGLDHIRTEDAGRFPPGDPDAGLVQTLARFVDNDASPSIPGRNP